MITLSEFTEEILSKFPTYEADIDKVTIKTEVIKCLRKLGNNIAFLQEDVFTVRNSMVLLPEDFKSLKLGLRLTPIGCDVQGKLSDITDSYVYKERIENPAYFDEVNQEYVTSCAATIIKEKISLKGTNATFYYNSHWLSLAQNIDKKSFAANCINLHPSIRNAYPYEISITARTLNTNFKSGEVYLQYYALPTDDNGEIIIPEFTTGDIEDWITNHVSIVIAEFLIANNLNPTGIQQLYNKWISENSMKKRAAIVEASFKGLGKQWQGKFKKMNRQEIRKFEIPMLNYR